MVRSQHKSPVTFLFLNVGVFSPFCLCDNLPNLKDKGDLGFSAAASMSIDVGPGSNGDDSQ